MYKSNTLKYITFCLEFLLFSIFFIYVSTNALNLSSPQPIFKGNAGEKKVAFACNVFWGEDYLPDMLNSFNNNNIKITFFIGGSWANRFPELVRELSSQGHELGNHSYSHPHPNSISKEKNKEEILRTETLINTLTNKKTNLYAPPYGEYNETVLSAANELGYKTIMWSIDTIDWRRPSTEIIINRVIKKIHGGAIILIHPTESTAKALPIIIEELTLLGYTISPVSEIINQ